MLLLQTPPRTLRAVRGGSAAGPSHSRHFERAQQSGRFQVKADIKRQAGSAGSVANDPERKSGAPDRIHKIPLNVVCDKVRGLLPKSRGPFATWGQAEEPGVAFEGLVAAAGRGLGRSEMSTR